DRCHRKHSGRRRRRRSGWAPAVPPARARGHRVRRPGDAGPGDRRVDDPRRPARARHRRADGRR
ncbi:MAG: P-hydroxybenzoate hydroxylase, partial [uncultured Frankineae bacterium]